MYKLINWVKEKFFPETQSGTVESAPEDWEKLPRHVAIIMDGNGRWAKERGLSRSAGHRAGVRTLKEIVQAARKLEIDYITAYAFSTENWKRPQQEVDFLMDLFKETFERELDNFKDENIKVNVIGYKERLPESVQEKIEQVIEETRHNDGLTVNIALNYGGRLEILEAVKKVGRDIAEGQLDYQELTEAEIEKRLYTAGQPDPDLFIRPGGEYRISNFLLWQLAYTELYFIDTYWPDFDEEEFLAVLERYQNRKRRFGGLEGE